MPFPYARILCPVDFNENSVRAINEAAQLAIHGGGELHLLHVVKVNPLAAQGAAEGAAAGEMYQDQMEFARKQVEQMSANLPANVKHEITIEFGEPGHVIVARQKDLKADLVVMATHGRRGLFHLVMGSVTETVVRQSAAPVLTVRPAHGEEAK